MIMARTATEGQEGLARLKGSAGSWSRRGGSLSSTSLSVEFRSLASVVRLRASALALLLLLSTGCTRIPTVRAPVSEPAATAEAASVTGPASLSPSSEAAIDITSEPAGAMILVNDKPSGRTPLRVAVKTTAKGFCADYLTIKARFVASDASQMSQTTEADLTPREKAPKELVFTPQGVQRHLR